MFSVPFIRFHLVILPVILVLVLVNCGTLENPVSSHAGFGLRGSWFKPTLLSYQLFVQLFVIELYVAHVGITFRLIPCTGCARISLETY